MGKRGPLPDKARIELRPAVLAVQDVPPPPKGLLQPAREVWAAYWQSDVSRAVDPDSDWPVIERWIKYVDQWHRTIKTIEREGIATLGSQDQAVLSPAVMYLQKVEAALGRLETELGLTPNARARLGITFGERQMLVQQLNAMALESDDDGGDQAMPTEVSAWGEA